MKTRKMIFSIDEPCSASWETMSITERGKFCLSCQKEVIDFTLMSDRELVNFFSHQTNESCCGRLRSDQLDRQLLFPTIPKFNTWYNKFLAVISGLLLSTPLTPAIAQIPTQIPRTGQIQTNHNKLKAVNPITLSAQVIDVKTKEKLVGAHIVVSGDGSFLCGTSTDVNGHFQLTVDLEKVSDGQVEISYTGYVTKELDIEELQNGETIALEIGITLDEIIIVKSQAVTKRYVAGGLSTIIRVHGEEEALETTEDEPQAFINIYPNPFIDFITLELNWPNSEYILLRMLTMSGQEIFRDRHLTHAGEQSIELNFSRKILPAGSYVLTINNAEGEMISDLIVKVGKE